MQDAATLRQIKTRYRALEALMDERMRRQWAATEAQTYGRGGVSAVSSATGMSRNTIRKGLAELAARKKNPRAPVDTRIRQKGGGRKRLAEPIRGWRKRWTDWSNPPQGAIRCRRCAGRVRVR